MKLFCISRLSVRYSSLRNPIFFGKFGLTIESELNLESAENDHL